jgi:hypothetical protein
VAIAVLGCGAAHAATFTGTIFEDANYGGGVGRTRAASGGVGLPNVTVELYQVTGGAFIATTTTDAFGVYSLSSGATNAQMRVRVVNGSVRSARTAGPGCITCAPVQTFRTDATAVGTVTNVTNRVGGEGSNRNHRTDGASTWPGRLSRRRGSIGASTP